MRWRTEEQKKKWVKVSLVRRFIMLPSRIVIMFCDGQLVQISVTACSSQTEREPKSDITF